MNGNDEIVNDYSDGSVTDAHIELLNENDQPQNTDADDYIWCAKCSKDIRSTYFKKHEQRHALGPIPCPFPKCYLSYSHSDLLKGHLKRVHKKDVALPEKVWNLPYPQLNLNRKLAEMYPKVPPKLLVLPATSNGTESVKRTSTKRTFSTAPTSTVTSAEASQVSIDQLVAPLLALPAAAKTLG